MIIHLYCIRVFIYICYDKKKQTESKLVEGGTLFLNDQLKGFV